MTGRTRPPPAGPPRGGETAARCPRDGRGPEQGAQTVEWIGIGAVVVALVAGVLGFVPEVGEAVADAVSAVLEQVLQGG